MGGVSHLEVGSLPLQRGASFVIPSEFEHVLEFTSIAEGGLVCHSLELEHVLESSLQHA